MPWRRMGEWPYISTIPDLGTRWGSHIQTLASLSLETQAAVTVAKEVGWAPEPVRTLWDRQNSFASDGNRSPVFQPLAYNYIDWAISAANFLYIAPL
jgi:hypothetical protein